MSADAISTCPNCLERELREFHDFYTTSADGSLVYDNEDPPVRPITYRVDITLECRACDYKAELVMSSPLMIGVVP